MTTLAPQARFRAFDANGNPLAGGKLYTYQAGTSTPLATYTDQGGGTPNANPVVLDANGEANIWLTATAYKFTLKDANDVAQWTVDNIVSPQAAVDSLTSDLANTADPAKGDALIGVKQNLGGSVARTQHAKNFDFLSVKDFGAVGDNTTDDTSAFANAISAALSNKQGLYIPTGTYKITSLITVTMPNSASGPSATNYFSELTMFGDGFANSIINCTSSGFLKVIGSSQQHSINLQEFAVTTGIAGTNIAIQMDCSAYPFFGEWTAKSRINLHFRGNDGINNVKYWGTCVDAVDWSNIDFSGSMFDGASTPNGTGVVTRKSAGSYVCVFDFVGVHFRFLSVGYKYETGSQTANLNGCFFAQNVTDVFAPAGGVNHQGLSITNCECYKGAAGDGVYLLCAVPNFVFSGNRWAVHAGYRGVALDVTDMTSIIGNQFFPDVTPNTATAAIDIDGTIAGTRCIIENNNFASTTYGARFKAASSAVRFGASNRWTSGMGAVSVLGGSNHEIGAFVSALNGGVGFGTGAGGTVTQATNKTTAVTLNTPSGQITTNNAALAAGAEVAFTVNCSAYSNGNEIVLLQVANGNYTVRVTDGTVGSFAVRLKNASGGSLSDAVVISYAIIKVATS